METKVEKKVTMEVIVYRKNAISESYTKTVEFNIHCDERNRDRVIQMIGEPTATRKSICTGRINDNTIWVEIFETV